MKRFMMAIVFVILAGCSAAVGHEAQPTHKTTYSGGRQYNEWHDKMYIHCSKQPDPWRCARKAGIAF